MIPSTIEKTSFSLNILRAWFTSQGQATIVSPTLSYVACHKPISSFMELRVQPWSLPMATGPSHGKVKSGQGHCKSNAQSNLYSFFVSHRHSHVQPTGPRSQDFLLRQSTL